MGFLKRLFGGMNDMPQGDDDNGVDETMETGEEIVDEPMAEGLDDEETAVEDIV